MGWQIPDIFQCINNIGREMFVMLTGHELKKTGACRGSVSCWCLVLWSLPLAVCHGDLGKHSAKIICVHQEPHDRSEGQVQQTSNFKIPRLSKKKQNTTSLLTLQHQKCPRPSNLCKTLFLKVPSEPFKARPNIKKKWRQSNINVRPSPSTRGWYCLLCPDQSNSIKFTPSTNHSGT